MKRFVGIAAGMIKTAVHVDVGLPHLVDHITFGSFTLEPRDGNKEPVYSYDEERRMSLNAIGLKNQGIKEFLLYDLSRALEIKRAGCRLHLSLAPLKEGDLETILQKMQIYGLHPKYVDQLEINAACPNHRSDKGHLHDVLAHDPAALEALMKEATVYRGSKSIKIAPLMSNESLRACVEFSMKYDFDSIVSGNTLLIDAEGKLSVPKGGMAGAPLLEHALEQVRKLRKIIDGLRVDGPKPKIIGCGGIMSAHDVTEYINAGADGGTQVATYYYNLRTKGVRDLVSELV